MRIVYCEDCVWECHELGCKKTPKCSHESLREKKEFVYKQSEYDRYPFCSWINRYGSCTHFEEKKSVGRNLITLWKGVFGK